MSLLRTTARRPPIPASASWTVLLGLLAGFAAKGQTGTDPKLAQLSIEELLNVQVLSPTKAKAMSTRRSPGVVRVFTRQDIERYGFVTLREILATVPGVHIQEYRIGHQAVWIRGIKQRYNNKILWLIDGVPIRDSYYGHTNIDEVLPLHVVERIEILNGPGGVLYGSNAFSGVVSITTRSEGRSMRFQSGSFRSVGGALEFSAPGVYVSADYQSSGGFHPLLNSDGSAYRHAQDRDRSFALLKMEHGGFRSSLGYTRHKFADAYRKAAEDRFWTRQPVFGSMSYETRIAGGGSLAVRGYYQDYEVYRDKIQYTRAGQLRATTRSTLGSSLYGVDLASSFSLGAHTLLAGASFLGDKDTGPEELSFFPSPGRSPGLAVPGVHRQNLGTYVQDIWSLSEHVDFTAGVRYDYLSDFRDQLSYRVGLTGDRGVYYGKLLFGTAFRVPSFREYLDVASYNFSLRPEHLHTLEAQAGIAFSRGDINVTAYNNHYHHLIREVFVTDIRRPGGTQRIDDEYSLNADRSTITGLEFQAALYPTQRMTAHFGAGAILRARERIGRLDPSIRLSAAVAEDEADLPFVSGFTANALYSVQLTRVGHRAGVNASWVSHRDTPPEYQQKAPAAVRNPANAHGFFKLDLFGAVPITKPFVLNLRATNLFKRRIYTPPFDDPTGYDVEWPGRAFRFELVWRY